MRIWPSYFVAITLCFVLTRFIELPNRTVTTVDYLLNIPFINGYIGTDYVDGAHWYLTILVSGIVIYSIILKYKDKTQCCLLMLWLFSIGILLKFKPLVFIGTISYSIYLIHQNIGFIILNNMIAIVGQYYIWMSVLVSLISVTFGFIFYSLVEKPIGILLTRRKQSE